MTRIATLASSNLMLGLIERTQNQVKDLQTQVSTGKRSQTYAGISSDVSQLLHSESRSALLDRFEDNNDFLATQLDATESAVAGIRETVHQFRQALLSVASVASSGTPLDPQQASDLQDAAFRAMKNMQDYLNTDFDGRYLFSGSQVRTQPVQIGASSLSAFQDKYDGDSVVYPPSRIAQVGRSGTLSAAITGGLTMTGTDTITAANAGAFALLEPGATITISDDAGHKDTYTVVSRVNDQQITISGTLSVGTSTIAVNKTLASFDNTAVIDIDNWFAGDQITQTHRLDQDRSLSLTVDAADPGFEKAMRAFGLIAQGETGTAGSLEKHVERLDQALYLLNSALDPSAGGTAPFGAEDESSLDEVETELGFHQKALTEAKSLHTHLKNLLSDRVGKIENVDQTEVITQLLNSTQALQASYQTLASVRQLSLTQYM